MEELKIEGLTRFELQLLKDDMQYNFNHSDYNSIEKWEYFRILKKLEKILETY